MHAPLDSCDIMSVNPIASSSEKRSEMIHGKARASSATQLNALDIVYKAAQKHSIQQLLLRKGSDTTKLESQLSQTSLSSIHNMPALKSDRIKGVEEGVASVQQRKSPSAKDIDSYLTKLLSHSGLLQQRGVLNITSNGSLQQKATEIGCGGVAAEKFSSVKASSSSSSSSSRKASSNMNAAGAATIASLNHPLMTFKSQSRNSAEEISSHPSIATVASNSGNKKSRTSLNGNGNTNHTSSNNHLNNNENISSHNGHGVENHMKRVVGEDISPILSIKQSLLQAKNNLKVAQATATSRPSSAAATGKLNKKGNSNSITAKIERMNGESLISSSMPVSERVSRNASSHFSSNNSSQRRITGVNALIQQAIADGELDSILDGLNKQGVIDSSEAISHQLQAFQSEQQQQQQQQAIYIEDLEKRHQQQVYDFLSQAEQLDSQRKALFSFSESNTPTNRSSRVQQQQQKKKLSSNSSALFQRSNLVEEALKATNTTSARNSLTQRGNSEVKTTSGAVAAAKIQKYENDIAMYQRELAQVKEQLFVAQRSSQQQLPLPLQMQSSSISQQTSSQGSLTNVESEVDQSLQRQFQSLSQALTEKQLKKQTESSSSNSQRHQLNKAVEENLRFKETIAALVTEKQELEKSLLSLRQESYEVQERDRRMEELIHENNKVAEVCEKLTAKVEIMRQQLLHANEAENTAKAQSMLQEAQLQGLQSTHADLQQAYSNLIVQLSVLDCKLNAKNEQVETLRAHLDRETSSLGSLQSMKSLDRRKDVTVQTSQKTIGGELLSTLSQSQSVTAATAAPSQSAVNNNNSVISELKRRIEEYQGELAEQKSVAEQRERQLNGKVHAYKEKKDKYREKLKSSESRLVELQGEIERESGSLRSRIEHLQGELRMIKGEAAEQIASLQLSQGNLIAEKQGLGDLLHVGFNGGAGLNGSMHGTSSVAASTLLEEVQSLVEDKKLLKEELEQKNALIYEYMDQVAALNAKIEKLSVREQQEKEQQEREDEMNQTVQLLKQEIKTLNEHVTEKEGSYAALEETISACLKEKGDLEEKVRDLEELVSSQQSQGKAKNQETSEQDVEELKEALETAKESIGFKEERITQLTEECANYSLKMAEREEEFNLQFDRNEQYLLKLLKRKNDEYADLSSDFDRVQDSLYNLQEEFDKLKTVK